MYRSIWILIYYGNSTNQIVSPVLRRKFEQCFQVCIFYWTHATNAARWGSYKQRYDRLRAVHRQIRLIIYRLDFKSTPSQPLAVCLLVRNPFNVEIPHISQFGRRPTILPATFPLKPRLKIGACLFPSPTITSPINLWGRYAIYRVTALVYSKLYLVCAMSAMSAMLGGYQRFTIGVKYYLCSYGNVIPIQPYLCKLRYGIK